ncbi:hypothetical protein LJC04_04925 [Ruminococcaceae bacterium OttesenSCG-928-O06]|nr:hypothetical protein [Ruminococcaceae bacterium OttesenSCG-928-O06]
MKKIWIAGILCLGLLLAACGDGGAKPSSTQSTPPLVSQGGTSSPADDFTEKEVAGNVTAATETELTILTADGINFSFEIHGAEVTAPSDGMQEGDNATVHFTGILDETKLIQTVTVLRVVVTR